MTTTLRPIDSPEHQAHADGFTQALKDRQLTYPHHCDPNPFMRRTRDPLAPAVYPPGAGIGLKISDERCVLPGLVVSSNDPCGLVTLTRAENLNAYPQDYPYTFLEKLVGITVIFMVGFMLWCASTPLPVPLK